MKKIVYLFLLFISTFPSFAKAAEPVQYPNEVNVSVYLSDNFTITLNGSYQLYNKDTGAQTIIPQGTVLTIKKDSTGITVSYTGFSQNSATGFDLQELAGSSLSIAKVSNGLSYRGSFFLKPNGSKTELINILDMEDYLKGVVPSEMPASWPKEALKAQAIAARSYAANTMMLTSTAASQVYRGYTAEDPRTNEAIKETEGLVVKYNGKPIQAFFHSTSGGRTANVGDVWNSDQKYYPYLVSVEDPYESSPYSNWSVTYSAADILKSFGFTNSSTVLNEITLSKTGANGEVRGVTVKTSSGDKTITGNESDIRKLFPLQSASHYNMLYSNWFDIKVTKAQSNLSVQTASGTVSISQLKGQTVQTSDGQIVLPDSNVSIQTASGTVTNEDTGITSVTISGKGWGHRIGMSQYGAKGFAEKGWKAEQILTHYFKGTTVSK